MDRVPGEKCEVFRICGGLTETDDGLRSQSCGHANIRCTQGVVTLGVLCVFVFHVRVCSCFIVVFEKYSRI